jgi:hypothetical protein
MGESDDRGDVHLLCQPQEGDTKMVTTAAPGRAADPEHDTNKHANYAASKGVSLNASPKSTEGVTIKTDFTVEGELSKNSAGEGNFAKEGELTLDSKFAQEGNFIAERQVRCGRQVGQGRRLCHKECPHQGG